MVVSDADRHDAGGGQVQDGADGWPASTDGKRHASALAATALVDCSSELDERRRELVAAASHELKTPLTIVLGLCRRMLTAGDLTEAHATDAQRIRANAYVLLERGDELLLATRLDSGRVELEAQEVDVALLVREICEGFNSVAESRGQRLDVVAPARLLATVDDEKLLSVVSNLVANALKFAPTGGRVRCTVAERRRVLRIEVADSGPGVPSELREQVFERYRQGAGAATRPHGSGLGLAIVRHLVTLHGGTVTLGDAPEGGALFVVELPRRATTGMPLPRLARVIDVAERQRATVERLQLELTATGRRGGAGSITGPDGPRAEMATALVVTADAELGAFLEELVSVRWHVAHAVDTAHAARRLSAHDVVLLDGAAGTSAVRALRRHHAEVPVLAIACDGEEVAAFLHAGADDCVTKPFAAEELLARLTALNARMADNVGRAPSAVDVVAGAPGRRALERALRQQAMRCERYAEQAALMRCSLDDLAEIRRAHGPDVADRLVRSVIEAVRRRLRDTDVVAFTGGSELAVLLAHTDVEAARTAAAGVREAAERQLVSTEVGPLGTTVAVGVAAVSAARSPGRALLEAGIALDADRAVERDVPPRANERRHEPWGRRTPSRPAANE